MDRREAAMAEEILASVERDEAVVPALWFTEVVNGLLVVATPPPQRSSKAPQFLAELAALPIEEDRVRPSVTQGEVLASNTSVYVPVHLTVRFVLIPKPPMTSAPPAPSEQPPRPPPRRACR